jgi:hypothetical protein
MFKVPSVTPRHQIENTLHTTDSIFMTESGTLRFARDYGLIPYVVSVRQIKEIFASVNRPKLIVSSRLPTRDQLHSKVHSTAQISVALKPKEYVLNAFFFLYAVFFSFLVILLKLYWN